MKAHKVELLIVDFDQLGPDKITVVIENARYPNRCISPQVMRIKTRDVGDWTDDHPLNLFGKMKEEYHRLFEGICVFDALATPPVPSTGTPALCPGEDARECSAPSEPGSAEQFMCERHKALISKLLPKDYCAHCEVVSLRAQLQDRAREVLHLDNARQTLVDQLSASEATIQRLAPYLRHYPDCEWPSPRGCTCGLKKAYEAALAQPEAGSDDGAWEQDRRRWREGNSF